MGAAISSVAEGRLFRSGTAIVGDRRRRATHGLGSSPRHDGAPRTPGGAWTTETSLPAATGHEPGLTVFEWTLDHHFLLERSTVPCTPDSLAIIGPDPGRGAYLQHYFDARGVVRTYAMNLVDGVLTLERHAPDFSPLAFQQRFSGRFSNDGASIRGAWETSADGSMWAHDFDLTFARAESSEGDAGLASA